MRLHRLVVEAFGPFPGRVDVDLDALASSGIFLIHGATGAGKTSLLDAICFALYAGVPGARPGGRSLRSDHAIGEAVPRVQLELTAGGRRLRITRSPEFWRPKRRGTGETKVPASVTLAEETGDGWLPMSTRADEVGDIVKDMLGIGLEQFVKVVLLPQGEFAAFLRASPDSRRELLERLFDVSRFSDVEEWLAGRRRACSAALEVAQVALASDLIRVDDVLARLPTPLPGDLPDWDQVPVASVADVVTGLVDQVRQCAATALAERDAAERHERAHVRAHHDAVRQAVCRSKGLAAQAVLDELGARAVELAALARQVAAGRRAAGVAGDLRALEGAALRREQATRRYAAAAHAVVALGLGEVGDDPARVQALADSLAGFDALLAEAAQLCVGVDSARDRVRVQQERVGTAERTRADLDRQIDDERRRQVEVSEQVVAVTAAAAELPRLQGEVESLSSRLRLRRDVNSALARLAAAGERHREAAEQVLQAREAWLDLRQRHLDAMASRLAADLVDGQPCPVCGSAEHPSPADQAAAVPDDAVQRAEGALAIRQDELATAAAAVAGAQGEMAALASELAGDDRPVEELAAELESATAVRNAAQERADVLEGLKERADELAQAVAAAVEQRQQSEHVVREGLGSLTEMRAELARMEAQLAERMDRHTQACPCGPTPPTGDARSVTDVGAVQARHRAAADAVGELLDAVRTLAEAEAHETVTAEAATARLSKNGFASVADARTARLTEDTLSCYERLLTQAERDRVQAQTVLADPEVASALVGEPEDVALLESQATKARQTRQQADRSHAIAEQCDRDLTALLDQVSDGAELVARRRAEHGAVARLADTAAGLGSDNCLRMRLSAYVLAARLERVVELANERLAHMGEGRYRLQHSDAPVPGGRRSGLGLRVEDLWTGRARDTATLSGGESFMASLALALGLADGVREEAGGFEPQILFVDEGFGTLDEDSLEQVLTVLDDLRDGGRAVGVVSHVGDLRTRIPSQLHVTKAASGSDVQMVAS